MKPSLPLRFVLGGLACFAAALPYGEPGPATRVVFELGDFRCWVAEPVNWLWNLRAAFAVVGAVMIYVGILLTARD